MSFFRDFFGYSRRERRASFILVTLILLVIILKYTFPEKRIKLEYTVDSLSTELFIPLINYKGDPAGWGKVDLNLSDSVTLVKLPGIGPVLASRIIKYRKLLGGYVSVSQLKEVYGISDSLYNRLSAGITVDTSVVVKLQVNKPGYYPKHPYLNHDEAEAIFELKRHGIRFKSVSDLASRKIISSGKAEKLKHYFDFSY